jgi:HSP20 family protein
MFNVVPWKNKATKVLAGDGHTLTPHGNFPAALKRMRNEFEEIFNRFYRGLPFPTSEVPAGWPWGLTVEDEPNEIVVKAEAPGFEPGDFQVNVRGNELILRAAKKGETKKKGKYHETWERECYQSVTLPAGIKTERVEAKYHNGLLTIAFPKTEEGKGHKIAVKCR